MVYIILFSISRIFYVMRQARLFLPDDFTESRGKRNGEMNKRICGSFSGTLFRIVVY